MIPTSDSTPTGHPYDGGRDGTHGPCVARVEVYTDGRTAKCGRPESEHVHADLATLRDKLYGPDKPCRRTACRNAVGPDAEVGDHLGRAHLDPRDRAHYDGITTSFAAQPSAVRSAAMPIMLHHGLFGPVDHDDHSDSPRRALEVALDAAFREIDRLRSQVAAVQVDRDRQVRAAMARSADCDAHGEEIRDLNRQLTHWQEDQDRVERARLALLGEHQALRNSLDNYDRHGIKPGTGIPEVMAALRVMNDKTSRAHQRAFNNTTRKDT